MVLKRILPPLAGALVLATITPAPHPVIQPGYKPVPEHTQAQLAEQQKLVAGQFVVKEVGHVPVVQEDALVPIRAKAESNQRDGKFNVVTGSVRTLAPGAKSALQKSAAMVNKESSPKTPKWLWAVLAIVAGYGALTIARTYSERRVTVPKLSKKLLKR